MKKFFALLLAVGVLSVFAAGCNNSGGDTKPPASATGGGNTDKTGGPSTPNTQ